MPRSAQPSGPWKPRVPFRDFVTASALLLLGCSSLVSAGEPQTPAVKAGIASRVITPPTPLWMGGYANRTKPAEGKLQDLHAKALALEDARGERLVLVTTDLLGLPGELADQVADAVYRKTGLTRERLLLTASHTHCGPVVGGLLTDMYDLPADEKAKIDAYTRQLRGWMVDTIIAALDDLKPARLAVGMGKASFAVNRRAVTPKGIVNGQNPTGPVDHDVPVLRVEAPDGPLRAVVFGYACHNTTLQFLQWCGDYAGFAQAELEANHPGAVALFWAGCGGDANPLPRGTVELCRKYGHELATAVEATLGGVLTPVRGPLSARYTTIPLAFEHLPSQEQIAADLASKSAAARNRALRWRATLESGGTIADRYPAYPVQVWRLGDEVLWVALGGEVVVDYSRRLKQELGLREGSQGPAVWVTAYANDVMAYIPSERVLKEGGYEGGDAMVYYGLPGKWAAGIEEAIVAKAQELARQSKPDPGPLTPPQELAIFQVPAGFKVELVAAEPDVIDPVALAFDEDGRLFVAEMRGYPNGGVATGQVASGSIKLLEEPDSHGSYKKCTPFAEHLRFPTSIMPWRGGLLVAVAPDLIYYPDATHSGPGAPRTLYTGFELDNIQQLVNSLQWGLDNWVHGCAGGKGGTIHSTERPDAAAVTLRGRGIRFHPGRPGDLEPTSGGGQFGLAADAFERWFTATNSQHLRHIVVPDHYLRRNLLLPVSAVTLDIPDHGAACLVHRISPFDAWRVERTRRRKGGPDAQRFPSTELVPGGFVTSGCSPLVYTADTFPPAFHGNTFVCDPANNLIHRDVLTPEGATFVARRGEADREFLASTDTWFRPVNVTLGPDGAIYVVDFYREVIETPLSLPDDIKSKLNLQSRGRGRIWRVAPEKGNGFVKPALRGASTEELVRHLGDGNSWWRLTAQRLLVERQDPQAVKPLEELARKSETPVSRVHALWTLQGQNALQDEAITAALKDADPEVREQALRLADQRLARSAPLRRAVAALADDPSPRVRFQAALTLGEADTPETTAALATIIRRDGADPWTQTAVLSSAGTIAPALLEALVHDPPLQRESGGPPLSVLTRIAALVGAGSRDADLGRALDHLADKADGVAPWQVAVLEGLSQGMPNRPRPLRRPWDEPPPSLRESVQKALPFFERAASTAEDEARPVAERLAAIRLLGHGPVASCARLGKLLSPRNGGDVQLAVVEALSLHDDPRVAELLLSSWSTYSPMLRREVLEALFARPDRLARLLKAVEAGQVLAAQIEPARLDRLRHHPDVAIRKQAESLWAGQAAPERKQVVADYRGALDLRSDVGRGRAVFKKTCATCHRLENEGTEVGPDLLSALRNKTPETLLVDILDPSREVDPRYVNYLLETKAGRSVTGMIVVETPASITLRRAERAEDTILRSQIETVQATNKSLMPEQLETLLSKQDLADVIGYLLSVAAPEGEPTSLLLDVDAMGKPRPLKTEDDWKKRRGRILANVQLVTGALPDPGRKVALDLKVEEEKTFPTLTQKKITFAVERGDRLTAYLLVPRGLKGKAPAMLCLHQTTKLGKAEPAGVGGNPHLHYARELAERGYVTLAPDYPNYGDYTVDPYAHGYASATMKGIWNHMRAVDLLQSLAEVDGDRIGCIGHSLGGHNSLFVAAFDPRLKVVVTSCGFNAFPKYYGGDLTGWSHAGYMPRIASVYGKDPKRMPFDFPEILAALAPRPVFINAPLQDANFEVSGVRDCVAAARPVYDLLGAKGKLVAVYPEGGHDFPDPVRRQAYEFVDRVLGATGK